MIQLVKGTKDIYGAEVKAWQEIEGKMRRICETFGIGEIRTPAFEFTELFARGVGETTDIVQKEMYTFTDDGDRSLTLRPEGTSGAVRAYIEHGMHNQAQPTKLYYISPTFRCENTQAGRQRQFHQVTRMKVTNCWAPTVRRRMQRLFLWQLLYWRNWG